MVADTQGGKEQRRRFFRKELTLPAEAWLFALPDGNQLPEDRRIAATVISLSGSGSLLRASPSTEALLQVDGLTEAARMVHSGALIDLSIQLPHELLPLRILSRVVRVEETSEDALNFAVEFILLSPKETDRIVRLVSS